MGFLIARVARLPVAFPTLDIDVATDLRAISLERHEADIALRLVPPRDSNLIAQPLTTVEFDFYASPAVCAEVAAGADPFFVGFNEANDSMPDHEWLAQHFPRSRVAFWASDHVAQAHAAQEGAGVALLPHDIGRTMSGLQPCALKADAPERRIWLMTRRQDHDDSSIRLVSEFIANLFTTKCALFAS